MATAPSFRQGDTRGSAWRVPRACPTGRLYCPVSGCWGKYESSTPTNLLRSSPPIFGRGGRGKVLTTLRTSSGSPSQTTVSSYIPCLDSRPVQTVSPNICLARKRGPMKPIITPRGAISTKIPPMV